MASCGVAQKTVVKVQKRARELNLSWPLDELMTDTELQKLPWTEYMEDCRANGEEPLIYSRFCYHIRQDEQKHRATMHINRKPEKE